MAVDRRRIYHKRDRLRQLRAFCRVAQMGSITKAAESLDLAQPAVSLHVRELEYEMEARLFDRGGRGLSLNPAGERLYKHAEPLVQGMDNLSGVFVKQLGDVLSRRIHIGASQAAAAYVVPAYLQRFNELYPDMGIRVHTCRVSEGVERLLDAEFDFVLGAEEPALRNRPSILYHHIAYYDIVLITALDHPLAGRETVSPEEITTYPLVAPKRHLYSQQSQQIAAQRFGFDGSVTIEVSGWSVVKRYVEQGLGVSLVPTLYLSENDALLTFPLKRYFPTESFGVFTRRGRHLTPAIERLIRLMAPDFSA